MEINYIIGFWSDLLASISIAVSVFIAIYVHKLSRRLSAKEKYEHEVKITNEIQKLNGRSNIILADVKKYHPLRQDATNALYYKQGAEFYTAVPEFGIQFVQRPDSNHEGIPIGLVPFEWIEYIRDYDSEDSKPIIVCKFKGVKWYKNFNSPFKEINYLYNNPNFREGADPDFMRYTSIKPYNLHTN
jgi:hypothetical protein